MVASRTMRAIRELPLAAPLLLVALALFFGGGPSDGSIFWLGAGAAFAILVLLASAGVPGGWSAVVPLVALSIWCAASISWSWLPDRSWDYANRALVYALFAAVGLWAARRTHALAIGRLPGTLLAYVAIVALVLTYSRGGILTALVVCAAWFAFAGDRADRFVTLAAAGLPAVAVGAIAFVLPGVTSDAQPLHVRWHDGLVFGLLLVVGAAAAGALERSPRPRDTPAIRRLALAGAVLAIAVIAVFVAVHGIGSGAVGNGGTRLGSTSSNFRFTWWRQAWHGFR